MARKSKSMALASTQLAEGYVLPHNIAKKKKKVKRERAKTAKHEEKRHNNSFLWYLIQSCKRGHSLPQDNIYLFTRDLPTGPKHFPLGPTSQHGYIENQAST